MSLLITTKHLRKCGYCLVPGGQKWFVHHGLDWKNFVRNGLPEEAFDGINDALVKAVIRAAREEAAAQEPQQPSEGE